MSQFIDLASSIAVMLLAGYLWRRYYRRAGARSHVVEVGPDFQVAEGCPGCGSLHAPFAVPVRKAVVAASAGRQIGAVLRSTTFHFCLDCARRIKARKRLGLIIFLTSTLLGLFWPLWALAASSLPVVTPGLSAFFYAHETFFVYEIVLQVGLAFLLLCIGLDWLVSLRLAQIRQVGAGSVFCIFASRAYRDRFARLNGVGVEETATN